MRDDRRHAVEDHLHLAAEHVGDRRSRAAIRHVLHLDAGHRHEHFAGQMRGGAGAGRRHVDLAGIGLGVGDEFGDGLGFDALADRHHVRHPDKGGDGGDVAREIEFQVGVQRGVDEVGRIDQQHGVAVGLGIDHRFRADIAAGAGLVLDDELLPQPLREPRADQPRDDVVGAARRKADHPAHRPRRIVQRRGAADRSCQETRWKCKWRSAEIAARRRLMPFLPRRTFLDAVRSCASRLPCVVTNSQRHPPRQAEAEMTPAGERSYFVGLAGCTGVGPGGVGLIGDFGGSRGDVGTAHPSRH